MTQLKLVIGVSLRPGTGESALGISDKSGSKWFMETNRNAEEIWFEWES